jgi:transposase-like protein
MPGFKPKCPHCFSEGVRQVGIHPRNGGAGSTVYTYKCSCGSVFTFEVTEARDKKKRKKKSGPQSS